MRIVEITQYSEKALGALNGLLPQLSTSALHLSEVELREIIESNSSHLLMAEWDGRYCGTLTLITLNAPMGRKAWIEDVAVDESERGRGIGGMLLKYAVVLARELDVKTVNLTSRPAREAANELYKKIGFTQRETNVYQLKTRA
jgi:ribosomal protein S18 acetylase RimI-like enzyme